MAQDVNHNADSILESNSQSLIPDSLNTAGLLKLQKNIQSFNEKIIADLFAKTLEFSRPVHLNVPLEEPLSDFVNQPSIEVKCKIKYSL